MSNSNYSTSRSIKLRALVDAQLARRQQIHALSERIASLVECVRATEDDDQLVAKLLLAAKSVGITGWLWKEGKYTGFKRRFFVFDKQAATCTYYKVGEGHAQPEVTGCFSTRLLTVRRPKKARRGYPHTFRIELPRMDAHMRAKYVLAAASAAEAAR